jgi:hypothetical protein
MTDHPDCRSVHERLDEAALGASPDLARHLAACTPCAELVRRQRKLALLLDALPRAPRADFPAPAVPGFRAGAPLRLVRASWIAAAAAALLVAVLVQSASVHPDHVRIDSVVDVADAPAPADDPLLALTAGVEAVAMRRPTELR